MSNMSGQRDLKVVHLKLLRDRMRNLLFDGDHSDITFIAETERVPAHTLVLTASSELIRTRLLEGSTTEKKEIVLHNISVESLKQFLSYIYTGRLSLSDLKLETIAGILKISHDYGIKKLHDAVFGYLLEVISEQNACTIYATARSLNIEHLSRGSLDWIDKHADAFLEGQAILGLQAQRLREILQRDLFVAEEMKVFEAVKRWAANRPNDGEISSVVDMIRLPLIAKADLLNKVKKSNLVPADRLLDAIAWEKENKNGDLPHRGLDFIDKQADAFLEGQTILRLPARHLRQILQRDLFVAEEMKVFEAVKRWAANRPNDEEISSVVETIRLPLIAKADLLNKVKKSNLVPADRLHDAIAWEKENKNSGLPHRGSWVPEVNLATTHRGAEVVTGKLREYLLGPLVSKPIYPNITYHEIDDPKGITVQLKAPFKINHIVLKTFSTCSYYIEVSTSLDDWRRVIDFSNYCRQYPGQRKLYFEPQVCRYIRIVGMNSGQKPFRLVSFEAMFTEKQLRLRQGIVIPESNVALLKMGALVIEGYNGRQNNSKCQDMINGDWKVYDGFNGFTQHTIGKGCITVQLAQPYIIDSIRMLLWYKDCRKYSYFIETSADGKEWTRVVDRSSELCRSWQVLRFEARPVVLIKIVGTATTHTGHTNSQYFHIVHFECPIIESA